MGMKIAKCLQSLVEIEGKFLRREEVLILVFLGGIIPNVEDIA
jgi:hypothetical protein